MQTIEKNEKEFVLVPRDAWDKLIPFLQRSLQTSRQPRQRLT